MLCLANFSICAHRAGTRGLHSFSSLFSHCVGPVQGRKRIKQGLWLMSCQTNTNLVVVHCTVGTNMMYQEIRWDWDKKSTLSNNPVFNNISTFCLFQLTRTIQRGVHLSSSSVARRANVSPRLGGVTCTRTVQVAKTSKIVVRHDIYFFYYPL